MKTIPELNIEVEKEAHHKGICVKDMLKDIPKGWRLLKESEITFLVNDEKLRKELNILPEKGDLEIYEQPFELNKKIGFPVRRLWRSWEDCLDSWDGSLLYSGSSGRVRYCRDLESEKK